MTSYGSTHIDSYVIRMAGSGFVRWVWMNLMQLHSDMQCKWPLLLLLLLLLLDRGPASSRHPSLGAAPSKSCRRDTRCR